MERARSKIEYSSLATAFCPTEFTVGELRRVYEAVWGVALDPRNFHRKVTGTPGFLVPTGGTTTRQGGRPAQLFRAGGATLLNPRCCGPRSDADQKRGVDRDAPSTPRRARDRRHGIRTGLRGKDHGMRPGSGARVT